MEAIIYIIYILYFTNFIYFIFCKFQKRNLYFVYFILYIFVLQALYFASLQQLQPTPSFLTWIKRSPSPLQFSTFKVILVPQIFNYEICKLQDLSHNLLYDNVYIYIYIQPIYIIALSPYVLYNNNCTESSVCYRAIALRFF